MRVWMSCLVISAVGFWAVSDLQAQGSVYSEAKLYYNVLNTEVHMSEDEIKARNVQPNLKLLGKLNAYLDNPDESTRLYVYNILHSLMQNAHNAVSRRALIDVILRGISDPAENIRFATSKWLLTFPSEDFDESARASIRDFLKNREKFYSTQSYAILLAGHASVTEAESILRMAARTENEDLIRVKNTAYLALARMGDQSALTAFLKYYDAKKDTALSTDLLRDLAYTKQPRAIEIVINALNKDSIVTPYAAWYLADIFRDFPVKLTEAKISPENLQLARTWVKEHYDPDQLNDLLGGEIKFWR